MPSVFLTVGYALQEVPGRWIMLQSHLGFCSGSNNAIWAGQLLDLFCYLGLRAFGMRARKLKSATYAAAASQVGE